MCQSKNDMHNMYFESFNTEGYKIMKTGDYIFYSDENQMVHCNEDELLVNRLISAVNKVQADLLKFPELFPIMFAQGSPTNVLLSDIIDSTGIIRSIIVGVGHYLTQATIECRSGQTATLTYHIPKNILPFEVAFVEISAADEVEDCLRSEEIVIFDGATTIEDDSRQLLDNIQKTITSLHSGEATLFFSPREDSMRELLNAKSDIQKVVRRGTDYQVDGMIYFANGESKRLTCHCTPSPDDEEFFITDLTVKPGDHA